MKAGEYLDFVLDIYRTEHPGAKDHAIYQIMAMEMGATAGVVLLMAQRLGAEIGAAVADEFGARGKDDFLRSFEWRRVRMMVLERDGARCACCGRTAKDGVQINVDHIKPRKAFPQLALDPSNLQVLCHECNHGKGNRYSTDWRSEARS